MVDHPSSLAFLWLAAHKQLFFVEHTPVLTPCAAFMEAPPLTWSVHIRLSFSDLGLLRETFALLKSSYWQVLFVPGNHELW